MTRLAARLLPHAAARTGLHEPVNVRLVLTGPGGGTWDIAVGEGQPDPVSVRIIADAAGFCRLVANRITPAGLNPHVTGIPDGPPGSWPRRRRSPLTRSPRGQVIRRLSGRLPRRRGHLPDRSSPAGLKRLPAPGRPARLACHGRRRHRRRRSAMPG